MNVEYSEGYYIADDSNYIFSNKFKTIEAAKKEYEKQVEIHTPLASNDIKNELDEKNMEMEEKDLLEEAKDRESNFLHIIEVDSSGDHQFIN